jgi:hypothetical protein
MGAGHRAVERSPVAKVTNRKLDTKLAQRFRTRRRPNKRSHRHTDMAEATHDPAT